MLVTCLFSLFYSPTLEEKAQKDIEKYFATHVIVPSPAEDSVKFGKLFLFGF